MTVESPKEYGSIFIIQQRPGLRIIGQLEYIIIRIQCNLVKHSHGPFFFIIHILHTVSEHEDTNGLSSGEFYFPHSWTEQGKGRSARCKRIAAKWHCMAESTVWCNISVWKKKKLNKIHFTVIWPGIWWISIKPPAALKLSPDCKCNLSMTLWHGNWVVLHGILLYTANAESVNSSVVRCVAMFNNIWMVFIYFAISKCFPFCVIIFIKEKKASYLHGLLGVTGFKSKLH